MLALSASLTGAGATDDRVWLALGPGRPPRGPCRCAGPRKTRPLFEIRQRQRQRLPHRPAQKLTDRRPDSAGFVSPHTNVHDSIRRELRSRNDSPWRAGGLRPASAMPSPTAPRSSTHCRPPTGPRNRNAGIDELACRFEPDTTRADRTDRGRRTQRRPAASAASNADRPPAENPTSTKRSSRDARRGPAAAGASGRAARRRCPASPSGTAGQERSPSSRPAPTSSHGRSSLRAMRVKPCARITVAAVRRRSRPRAGGVTSTCVSAPARVMRACARGPQAHDQQEDGAVQQVPQSPFSSLVLLCVRH